MSNNHEDLQMEIGCLVELREGMEKVYPLSYPGARAKVIDYTIDPEGYERILVSWDKNHWRYNGEKNNWTYATHFKVIAPPALEDKVAPKVEPQEESVPRFDSPKVSNEDNDPGKNILKYLNNKQMKNKMNPVDRYASVMNTAFESVQNGSGFFIFTYSPTDEGRMIPILFSAALDDESAGNLREAVVAVASQIVEEYEDDDDE